ncbi:MAG: NUDIX hydrolase [Deinococcota bacterium]
MDIITPEPFRGCKLALIHNHNILVYKRDNRDDIPFPNMWDLPGGGREGDESPEACVLRELTEEFGISLSVNDLGYRQRYKLNHLGGYAYFFAAQLRQQDIDNISFGDEGQYWQLMDISSYLAHPEVIAQHKTRLLDYLKLKTS